MVQRLARRAVVLSASAGTRRCPFQHQMLQQRRPRPVRRIDSKDEVVPAAELSRHGVYVARPVVAAVLALQPLHVLRAERVRIHCRRLALCEHVHRYLLRPPQPRRAQRRPARAAPRRKLARRVDTRPHLAGLRLPERLMHCGARRCPRARVRRAAVSSRMLVQQDARALLLGQRVVGLELDRARREACCSCRELGLDRRNLVHRDLRDARRRVGNGQPCPCRLVARRRRRSAGVLALHALRGHLGRVRLTWVENGVGFRISRPLQT